MEASAILKMVEDVLYILFFSVDVIAVTWSGRRDNLVGDMTPPPDTPS